MILDGAEKSLQIVPFVSYFEDVKGELTIDEVSSEKYRDQFIQSNVERVNPGTTSSIFWARVRINNRSEYNRWLLVSNQIWLTTFEIYRESGQGWEKTAVSAYTPFQKRAVQNRKLIIPLFLFRDSIQTFYIRIGANNPALDLTLEEPISYVKKNQDIVAFDLLLFGVVLAMIVYNGILSLILRSIIYFYYVFYLIMISMFLITNKGYGLEYLWHDAVRFNFISDVAFMSVGTIFLALFTARFLLLRQRHPKLYGILLGVSGVNSITCMVFVFAPSAITAFILNTFYLLLPVIFLFTGFYSLFSGFKPAILFLFGYSLLFLSVLMTLVSLLGAISSNFALQYGVQIGVALEAMVFSYALADRINRMKEERARLIVQNMEKDKILLRQSQKAMMGEMISVIAHQWKQPLNAISIDCGDLSDAYQFNELDKNYIDKFEERMQKYIRYMIGTIDDFRNFFNPNKERKLFYVSDAVEKSVNILQKTLTNARIDVDINVGDAKVFGIENELQQVLLNLLSNSVEALLEKQQEKRYIAITADSIDGMTRVCVRDNGGGIEIANLDQVFEPYFTTKGKSGTGTGLYMVKMVVTGSFGGNVTVVNESEGACFSVILPADALSTDLSFT